MDTNTQYVAAPATEFKSLTGGGAAALPVSGTLLKQLNARYPYFERFLTDTGYGDAREIRIFISHRPNPEKSTRVPDFYKFAGSGKTRKFSKPAILKLDISGAIEKYPSLAPIGKLADVIIYITIVAENEFRFDISFKNPSLGSKEEYFDDPIETEFADEEGKSSLKKHLVKERSTKLIKLFKSSLESFDCKICGLNFEKLYGEIGANFIEAHHTKPLALINEGELVSIKDLIPVCSNCHRMLHRNNPPLNWRDLKKKTKQ